MGHIEHMDIHHGKVGNIIGFKDETLHFITAKSGANIQIARDLDILPNSITRRVTLSGTRDQVDDAKLLIEEAILETRGMLQHSYYKESKQHLRIGEDTFSLRIPNNQIHILRGKDDWAINEIRNQSGALVDILRRDLDEESTKSVVVYVEGDENQKMIARDLIEDVMKNDATKLRNIRREILKKEKNEAKKKAKQNLKRDENRALDRRRR